MNGVPEGVGLPINIWTRARPRLTLSGARKGIAMAEARVGIVTVSDRASRGEYQDKSGPAIRDCLAEILSCPWEPVARLIPDERPLIESTLVELCDAAGCCLVV